MTEEQKQRAESLIIEWDNAEYEFEFGPIGQKLADLLKEIIDEN